LESYPKCVATRYKTNKDYREEECVASMSKAKKRKKAQQKTSKPMSKEKKVYYYVPKKVHALVMWYLPFIDRLRCLFANPKDAKLMRWHASDEHKNDGKLQHRVDEKQWQDSMTNTETLLMNQEILDSH
jgi:hypothetical protein